MKVYRFQQSERPLPAILLLTHGVLGVSIAQSAQMILSEMENVAVLALEEGDDPEAYGEALRKLVDEYGGDALLLVDLVGGTPGNQAMQLLKSRPQLCAVGGLNLTMLIEAVYEREQRTGAALAEYLTETAKNGIADLTQIVAGLLKT